MEYEFVEGMSGEEWEGPEEGWVKLSLEGNSEAANQTRVVSGEGLEE